MGAPVTSKTPEKDHQQAAVIQPPPNRAIVLRNITCAYCGRPFDGETVPTREHVIGRRFVPRGCFAGQWNLILNACERCNNDKADLEDDISAITMMPDVTGEHAIDDERLRAESARKAAKARSRRTRKAVGDSQESFSITHQFGPATFTFNLVGPPQVEEDRVYRLAHYQVTGFFYWITYNEALRTGGFPIGRFYPLLVVRRADWGAPRMKWFMDLIREWDLRVHAIAADGFCKVLIRKSPQVDVWCWAVEWNHSHRVIGLVGDEEAIRTIGSAMPTQPMQVVHQSGNDWVRMRTEVPIGDAEDDLFGMRECDFA
jgi:hypothetical protein